MDNGQIKIFHNDDQAYEEWTAQHGGFVLTTPRKGEHMLHTAGCGHLGKGNFELRLTRKPRRWSAGKEPLVALAEQATGTGPMLCQSCM